MTATGATTNSANPISVDLTLDYGLLIDTRAVDILRTTASHSAGIFRCSGDDLHMEFVDSSSCGAILKAESKAINDAYEELDPARDCLILFDKQVFATVGASGKQRREKCKALAIIKRRSVDYRGLN